MSEQELMETVEAAVDATEQALDLVEDVGVEVVEIVRSNPITVGAAAVLGLAAGGAAGYFLTKKYLVTKYDKLLVEEIEDAREFYKRQAKAGELSDVGSAADALLPEDIKEKLRSYSGSALIRDEEEEPEVVVVNDILVNNSPLEEDDYDEDEDDRDLTVPHILTHDEYYENEHDWEQISLTYYESDGVLIDDQDSPIPDHDSMVGEGNLLFGRWSKDQNIVYICNPDKEMLFEVARSRGSYSKEVLGFDDDDTPTPRMRARNRVRGDDE